MSKYLFAVFAFCFAFTASGDELAGKIVSVLDGDTVTVLDSTLRQHKIRLQGIDAPEKGQAFGQSSKAHLSNMVFGSHVTVQFDKTDKYGRILGRIIIEGEDMNLRQIAAGTAWHYKVYEREQSSLDQTAYANAEVDARQQRLGLWADKEPVPPWEFRRTKRNGSSKNQTKALNH